MVNIDVLLQIKYALIESASVLHKAKFFKIVHGQTHIKSRPPYAPSLGLPSFPLQPLLLRIIVQPCVLLVMA
jgi:hypothetical protein